MSIRPVRGGLSASDQEKLDKWTYDEQANRMSTDASVRSGLNSFELAEMHTTHSGGENVFDQNNVSGINWFPVWQGVKPLPASPVGEHVGLNPTVRQYSNVSELLPNGSGQFPVFLSYRDEITLVNNESVMFLEVRAGEEYQGKLTYTIRDSTQTGTLKYQQIIDVNCVSGDMIQFNFTHPSESMKGDTIAVNIIKEDGADFLVWRVASGVKPYLKLYLTTFVDIPVWATTQVIRSSVTVRYSGDYEVDTSGGVKTLTVPVDFKDAFIVSDIGSTFSGANYCNVDFSAFGQGIAKLQTPKDSYKFFYDETNSQWRYKDLNAKGGGVV